MVHIHWGKTLDVFEKQHRSSLNMCILTQLVIFAFWSFLRPFFKLRRSNLVQLKTRLKMCHTFKHLFICNTFCCRLILLSSSLYIELALVCCTNPDNVNCFGTIFPNLNFVFASIWAARPVHIESDQYRSCSTVKQGPAVGATPSTPIGEQPKQCCGSGFAK